MRTGSAHPNWQEVGGVSELTQQEFDGFRELIRRHVGIHLNPSKKALLFGRLSRRIREMGLRSFGEYLLRVREDDEERTRMIDRITTNETRFFREPQHFAYLDARVIPAWIQGAAGGSRRKEVRAWSAGCSTGEEPYSLAMALLDRLPVRDGWTVGILATDVSTRVLDIARQATWSIDRAREIAPHFLKGFMLQGVGSQSGKLRAAPELRQVVRVEHLNLSDDSYSVAGQFDLVFCRNVLIYFDQQHKHRVVERLASHLAPDGHLFVGHAESIQGIQGLSCVGPTVYAKRDPGGATLMKGSG